MSGESDLRSLLRNMRPQRMPGEYVFCSVKEHDVHLIAAPLLVFREDEGVTVVISREQAESLEFNYDSIWGLITLSVHSDLTAVGFLARITHHLAQEGVSVNVVSAYYHDHLFVPNKDVDRTVELLSQLSRDSL
ncbi:MAG: ACT domain-containing protein [Candidatus Thorarchaeota archaeon]